MKFQLDYGSGAYAIRAYRPGAITVNAEDLTQSFIITPDRLFRDWPPQRLEDITAEHLDVLAELEPEIVIIGTGSRLRFPDAKITARLLARNVGVEIMDTAAACRGYTVLMAEGRQVAAALIMIGEANLP
jgi:uncharacterized protein